MSTQPDEDKIIAVLDDQAEPDEKKANTVLGELDVKKANAVLGDPADGADDQEVSLESHQINEQYDEYVRGMTAAYAQLGLPTPGGMGGYQPYPPEMYAYPHYPMPPMYGGYGGPPMQPPFYGGYGGQWGNGGFWHGGGRPRREASGAADAKVETKASDGPLEGRVWDTARDAKGCRELQDALDNAKTDEERAALGGELKGHVWEAIECKNANHVLQKYIVTMRPEESQFIIDELKTTEFNRQYLAHHAARHCFGCRVIERLLEHCSRKQVEPLVEEILLDGVSLCKHQYGNYVAQHLLEHGSPDHQRRISEVIQQNAHSMCTDYHAVAVVSQSLCNGPREDRINVARAILNQKNLVVSMARSRHGQEAVKHLLQVPGDEERTRAWRLLSENKAELQKSRYGRVVVKYIESQGGSTLQKPEAPDSPPGQDQTQLNQEV